MTVAKKQSNPRRTKKIIVITGPTASGKSGLAVELARKFDGEVISADSRQVYRALDIGSGKVEGKWKVESGKWKNKKSTLYSPHSTFFYKGIPHHCIDFVSPKKVFTASDFKKCAEKAMEDIWSRGKVPIICGGTAFYIDTLLGEMPSAEIPPDWELRKKLGKKTTAQLFAMLKKLDPIRASNIDAKNPHRLIRAIEIAKACNLKPKTCNSTQDSSTLPFSCFKIHVPRYKILKLGVKVPQETLDKKIKKRLDERFKIGMIDEVKKLRKAGVTWKRLYDLGLEYRWISLFLRGQMTRKEMEEKLFTEIRRYSKRQMTWLKHDPKIKWIEPNIKQAIPLVKKFLSD